MALSELGSSHDEEVCGAVSNHEDFRRRHRGTTSWFESAFGLHAVVGMLVTLVDLVMLYLFLDGERAACSPSPSRW